MQKYRCKEERGIKEDVKVVDAKPISYPDDFILRSLGSFKNKAIYLSSWLGYQWTLGKDEEGATIVFLEKEKL